MKNILFIITSLLVLISCSEDVHGPLSGDKSVPPPVFNVSVENLSGAAKITYSLPVNDNLLYIKAVYTIAGVTKDTKVSSKVNSLYIEGFDKAEEYEVALYSVSKGEVESAPVLVKVYPLTPPIASVYDSLNVFETFGGIVVQFENKEKANISIEVLVEDISGWKNLDTYYTKLEKGMFAIRGLNNEPIDFAICVRDRWLHTSDTLKINMTPLFEEELNIRLFKDARFPGEALDHSSAWSLAKIWDNDMSTGLQVKLNTPYPFWFTFDLGVTAKLSRFKLWQRQGQYIYSHFNPHEWELWGSNNPDQGWNNWTRLGHFVMVKPSGLPVANNNFTEEDRLAAEAGNEFEIEIDAPAVRYIRWRHIDSWATIGGTAGSVSFMEIRFFGSIE
ncbi:hypothetical protein GGR21_003548 [Dysgonomonas hofstadii]|uniref:DUF4959 domain-containing protein n=1 Tax=Dysgonomonas hofstadii TaxID=637886 RepID=A0A840CTW3_9BACT|nr:DUF5000 domain-containing lipoprotein [Dysgonomonas hofstadii]MBB4037628.1 hypothetical protein [Dysgonomonas hofstadii]